MARKIRVLVADDHAILRGGLAMLINAQPDMELVGEAGDGPETLKRAAVVKPDVVVFDLTMPNTDSLRTIRELRDHPRAPQVLILTMHDDPAYLDVTLATGASGFVTKKAADAELLAAIRAVSAGRQFVDATLGRGAAPRRPPRTGRGARGRRELLSRRENEVLKRVGAGHTNKAIAKALSLSVKTVETYRARLCNKLRLHDRADLVRYALQTGLVSAELLPLRNAR